jgi:anti-anti-sigma regulatory factor
VLRICIDNIVDVAIVECEGSIVRSEEAFQLFKGVTSQAQARVILLDLSEVRAIERGGIGILLFLRCWTQERHMGLKLFNPRNLVRYSLEVANPKFDFATLNEMLALLAPPDQRYAAAAPD